MPLITLEDFYPTYREGHSDSKSEIKNFEVCTHGGKKVGSVTDILVDDQEGRFRYLVVDVGLAGFGKKVLLPIGLAHINYTDHRVYVEGLSKEQVERLPELHDLERIDHHHEEQVRDVYRPAPPMATVQSTVTGTSRYEQDPDLYAVNDVQHQSLKLYEERLIANKRRQKTGEVAIGKHVETETARVSVPVEKERVVITRVTPVGEAAIVPGATFQEGEVARMEVYEETPDIHKEAFVREEVRVTKVVEQNTVMAEETLRREELDVDTQGHPVVDRGH